MVEGQNFQYFCSIVNRYTYPSLRMMCSTYLLNGTLKSLICPRNPVPTCQDIPRSPSSPSRYEDNEEREELFLVVPALHVGARVTGDHYT